MHLSDFIENHIDSILREWEKVAERQRPGATSMSRKELRDMAGDILRAVAHDMRLEQSEEIRHERSLGKRPEKQGPAVTESARGHAQGRLSQGFTLNQLVAEYRALRASVIRRWRAEVGASDERQLEQLTRFNEAIDQSLADSVNWYNARIEDARVMLNGILAHDLRGPLGAVLMSTEVFLHDDSLSDLQMRTAVRIRNSSRRMETMINDLLDFTRTRLGTGLPVELGDYDMGRIIRDVVEEHRAFHPAATVNCEPSGDLSGCWDHARIEQMLGNLIGNAIEHGGDSPVTVTAKQLNSEIAVSVHNEEGFIPQEEQRVIFDPMQRAAVRHGEERPGTAGLGLGLYIACQIAEAHGGVIDLDSSPERGTTFTVRLPRRREKGAGTAGMT